MLSFGTRWKCYFWQWRSLKFLSLCFFFFSLSLTVLYGMLIFPTSLTQQFIFLTSYICSLLGTDFLDIIARLCPHHCQNQHCFCQIKSSDDTQFHLRSQTVRVKGLVFFCCFIFHFTYSAVIYYKTCSISLPWSIEPHDIFQSIQF